MATFSMTVSAYASGLVSYRLYREKFASRIRKLAKKRAYLKETDGETAHLQNGDVNETKEEEEEESDEVTCSTPDIITG